MNIIKFSMNIIKFCAKKDSTLRFLFVMLLGWLTLWVRPLPLQTEHRGLTILNFLFSMLSGCAQLQLMAIWLAGPLALGALAEHSDGSSRHRVTR